MLGREVGLGVPHIPSAGETTSWRPYSTHHLALLKKESKLAGVVPVCAKLEVTHLCVVRCRRELEVTECDHIYAVLVCDQPIAVGKGLDLVPIISPRQLSCLVELNRRLPAAQAEKRTHT